MFLNLFEIRYPQCALSSGLEESQEVRQDQPDLGNVFPIPEFRVFSKPLAALSSVSVQRPHQSDFMIPAIYSWARIMHLKVWLSQLFSGRRDGVDGLLKPSQRYVRMATIDSGTETLFSDDSPCELPASPGACSPAETEVPILHSSTDQSSRFAPPNIQPYSGVLEKGKVVIRPIAFKPAAMTPAARFGLAGERYGSTPILTRPGSRLTLYGSSGDLRHSTNTANYSLDRKLKSSCPSTASSPPTGMSSLTSLPHKLVNYDSLESVRKSPVSVVESSMMNKSSYRLSGCAGGGSLLDLTPSPSDSGVSELEAALRDRDSELAYLRQTMEHNEQVIFRVYQEKERVWERELRRLKSIHESRLRASAQKALKLEQMLMMQTYQLQQEKKRLGGEVQRANCQSERLRQEVNVLRGRLEETEWGLCQKTGEISLLKSQLKDYQNEQTAKGHELLQIRNECREMKEMLETREAEVSELRQGTKDKDEEIDKLRSEIKALQQQVSELQKCSQRDGNYLEAELLRAEIRELREELSDMSLNEYGGIEPGRTQRSQKPLEESEEDIEIQRLNARHSLTYHSCPEVEKLREEFEIKQRDFENERKIWAQEKEKVLRYQRQLQMNYVQMYRRNRALEAEVESLAIELELDKTGMKKLPSAELSQTIEL